MQASMGARLGRFLICSALIARAFAAQEIVPPRALPTAAEINSVLKDLSEITGFQIHKQLPFAMVTRDQVNRFLKDQIRRSVKPEEIRAEEVTLKKFGFVPPDFDLRKTTIDLLTEQAAAYYDFHRKKLFISDWANQNMRETAVVHELAHALADQNFSIQKFLAKAGDDSEEAAARESVVEGQASWLMVEYAARRMGRTLAEPETAREYLKAQTDTDDDDGAYPVFGKAPLYLKRTLMFPYDDGGRFQQAVFAKSGRQSFAEVFRKPPISTSQVMHPDRYFTGVPFTAPELPKPIAHTKAFVSGKMGELDHSILLRQFLDEQSAESLAPRLKGAAYRIDESRPERRTMLIYASDWDSEDSAARYFDAYERVLRTKWKQIEVSKRDGTRFAGKSEDGYFSVSREGVRVRSEEGFADPRP